MADELKEEVLERLSIAKEKLESAQLLLDNQRYANSVSKAYYAMYHAARAVLFIKNVDPHKHSGVVKMFGLHYVQPAIVEKKYSKALSYIKELRERCDYESNPEVDADECEKVLQDAKEFVKRTGEIVKLEFR